MKNIVVVTGSVRPNSANKHVVEYVQDILASQSIAYTTADLKELNLPFFDDPLSPTNPEFKPTHENVIAWTKMVAESAGVIFVTPEYNHTMSPVQLNAIDWIGKEWQGKPVALIGYGWTSGANQAHATAREALAVNLKARVGDNQANLFFTRDLNPNGSILDATSVERKVRASIDELRSMIDTEVEAS